MVSRSARWAIPLLAGVVCHISSGEATLLSPPGKMVEVDGHALHLYCSGKGQPTVVLVGGAGEGFSFDWASVQPDIAKYTRVCSYDRAGYAWSDPGPEPRTLRQNAYELRTALHAAHEHAPFVLVGHSLGALIVGNFAELYPAESAGFVLVDGTHENSPLLLNNKVVFMRQLSHGRAIPEVQKSMRDRRTAKPMQASNATRPDPPYDRLPPKAQEFRQAAMQGDYQETNRSEFDFLPEEMNDLWLQRQKNPVPFGHRPLIVISAAPRISSPPVGVSEDDWKQLNQEKAEQQADMAKLSLNSKAITAKTDCHEIHVCEPDLVVSAVREDIEAVRSKQLLR